MGPDVDRIRGQQKESEPIRVDWQKGKEAILSEACYKECLDRQETNQITFSAQL
jgi:hypothetical protein